MWRMRIIYTVSLSIILIGSIARAGDRAFGDLIFIDHENLRYVEGSETTAFQVNEIKRNLDEAKKYGLDAFWTTSIFRPRTPTEISASSTPWTRIS